LLEFLIIRPNDKLILYGETEKNKLTACEPPYFSLLLASYLNNEKRSVIICDLEVDTKDKLIDCLLQKPINIILSISGHNPSASLMSMISVDSLCNLIKEYSPNSTIHLHGLYPSTEPHKILKKHPLVNSIIIGEGFTYLNILNGYKRSDKVTINDIPPIDWDKFGNLKKYRAHNWHLFGRSGKEREGYAIAFSSWGCPYNCDFCCIHSMHKQVQQRDISLVFQDLKNLYDRGIRNIKFMDELFTMSKKRVIELCYKIIDNRMVNINAWAYARTDSLDTELIKIMREAGIRFLGIGYESGSQSILDSSDKKQSLEKAYKATEICKSNSMNICGNFVFGLLDDNLKTMEDTLKLAIDLQPEWANFNIVQAFPGTKLYEKVKTKSWFKEPELYEQYSQHGYYATPMGTEYLTPKEVLEFKDRAFREFFMYPPYLQMIEDKFGLETRQHIENDFNYYPKRKILE
jgi:anaerobic magnesium-protoporphyrin IX monomethyl ester cyclase